MPIYNNKEMNNNKEKMKPISIKQTIIWMDFEKYIKHVFAFYLPQVRDETYLPC